ncbi:two-component system, OmpR family, response regulator VicR [Acetoanaerobium noterae]|uniref:Stage 0 sporulation protein A homolog n=1 Tax=Acetoanaerobium noterae TaxID=745369 RepID=A0A1T5D0Y5_9FIRM|nr:response regulator YycF [Acetoanaerobium noterae]MBP8763222.1 response regulator transcription factor [Acetoanaerobium sp.]MBP9500094.1 response regulator transcription factor [Acetoanaerobium sp.]MBP9562473.1 response regulator transcription factor [Acetoanaerobium sp.]SKB65241.1 two-component system, OmpR family, response regulator VicR [Acetoanaerobium noterae]
MKNRVLIAEDEKPISDIIKFNLEKEGYEIITAYDGEDALKKALNEQLELIILDIMLPSMDGFEICKRVREKSSVPIIMVTAKEEEVDKILGLELGADDYITKPFSIRELVARVKANVRRQEMNINADQQEKEIIKNKDLSIDLMKYEVKKGSTSIDLTVREFELLKFLAKQKDQVFSREQLLERVWGYEYYGDIRTVDVTVRRLREKVEDDSSNPTYIMTKRGVGYYFKGE